MFDIQKMYLHSKRCSDLWLNGLRFYVAVIDTNRRGKKIIASLNTSQISCIFLYKLKYSLFMRDYQLISLSGVLNCGPQDPLSCRGCVSISCIVH